jgi:probable HAF family extracellular repeat protein
MQENRTMFASNTWLRVGLMTLLVLWVSGLPDSLSTAKGGNPKPPPEPPLQYAMTYVPISCAGMNNVGDVVGSGIYLAETDTAYDLNALFAEIVPQGTMVLSADDINDPVLGIRQIAGKFSLADCWGNYAFRGAFGLDEDGEPIALEFTPLPGQVYATKDTPPEDQYYIEAYAYRVAINDVGDVVGSLQIHDPEGTGPFGDPGYAVLWPAAEPDIVDLCPTSSESRAMDINNAGQVTGWMRTATGEMHAYRYSPGTPPPLLDLGGLPKRPTSYGLGINNLGQVVGNAKGSYYYERVMRYTDGVGLEELGNFFKIRYSASWSRAINSRGHVVGWAAEYPGDVSAGFLYTDSAGFVDLATLISNPPPELDVQSIDPVAINDFADHTYGQILVGTNLGGFVLTPSK